MFTTIVIFYIIASMIASVFTIAALMLSSRISQKEKHIELYEVPQESPQLPQFVPATYSLEN